MDDQESIEEAAKNPLIYLGCSLAVLAYVVVSYHWLEARRQEPKIITQIVYWSIAVAAIVFLPTGVSVYLFSPLTVGIVATVFPVYESVRSVCTPTDDDDKEWLQFWITGGFFLFVSSAIGWIVQNIAGDEFWYKSVAFISYWLYFPLTNGSLLIYENITVKYVSPVVTPLQSRIDNVIKAVYQTTVNGLHLWILWVIFLFLPEGFKRLVAVAVGTVYPVISSIGAAATNEVEDDAYWLTYWSVFGALYLVMDVSETWLGWIPGFYSLIISICIYLMLPMFSGAEKAFRKILVPLFGLTEMLMVRDAVKLKKQMFKDLDPVRAMKVRKAIAGYYDDDDDVDGDAHKLNDQLSPDWNLFKMPKLSNFFGKNSSSDTSDPPTETTNLIV